MTAGMAMKSSHYFLALAHLLFGALGLFVGYTALESAGLSGFQGIDALSLLAVATMAALVGVASLILSARSLKCEPRDTWLFPGCVIFGFLFLLASSSGFLHALVTMAWGGKVSKSELIGCSLGLVGFLLSTLLHFCAFQEREQG
jgi:hypothetical protein